jgi:hypothetical protein
MQYDEGDSGTRANWKAPEALVHLQSMEEYKKESAMKFLSIVNEASISFYFSALKQKRKTEKAKANSTRATTTTTTTTSSSSWAGPASTPSLSSSSQPVRPPREDDAYR